MQRNFAALIVIVSMTAGASAAMAQGRGREQYRAPDARTSSASPSIFGGFGNDERRIITEWFHDPANSSNLPPGLAKREHLPPVLQKQLIKNGRLPPGLEKKMEPLPRVLEVRLSRLPEGRRRIVIGGNVILMDETTSMIVDIIVGVL
jgi:hypothetical protein